MGKSKSRIRYLLTGIVLALSIGSIGVIYSSFTSAQAVSDGVLIYNLINNGTEYDVCIDDKSVTSVVIPYEFNGKPVTKIANNGFASCSNLQKVIIPKTVTSIGNGAFLNCRNLQKVLTPQIEDIGMNAFALCSNVLEFVITDSVNTIGNSAFRGFTNDSTIYVAGDIKPAWIEANAFNSCNAEIHTFSLPEPEIQYSPMVRDGIEGWKVDAGQIINNEYADLVLSAESTPDGKPILEIDGLAFIGCTLNSLTIENSGQPSINIRSDAFNCSLINYLYLGDNVTFNDEYSTDINPDTNVGISERVFATGIFRSITLPDNLSIIGNDMFNDCRSLSTINTVSGENNILPNMVSSIGSNAFKLCTSLSSLTIPAGLQTLGAQAFAEWTSNQTLEFMALEVPDEWRQYCGEAFIRTKGIHIAFETYGTDNIETILVDRFSSSYKFEVPANKPGYQFIGWYSEESVDSYGDLTGGGLQISNAIGELRTSLETFTDTTFYAKWEIINYQISYVLNGGTLTEVYPIKFNVKEGATLVNPVKSNAAFRGWYLNNDFTGEAITYLGTEYFTDITLYAKWADRIEVTFKVLNPDDAYDGYEDGRVPVHFEDTVVTGYEDTTITAPTAVKDGFNIYWYNEENNIKISSGQKFVPGKSMVMVALPEEQSLSETNGYIYGPNQLNELRNEPNFGQGKTYWIMADITVEDWIPLPEFRGNLNGGDDGSITILNTVSNSASSSGAFVNINRGKIDSVNLTANLEVSDNVQYAGLIAGYNEGYIQRCVTKGSIVSSAIWTGGICGYNKYNSSNDYILGSGQTFYCTNYAKITTTCNAGGIAGWNATKSYIQDCKNYGDIEFSYGGWVFDHPEADYVTNLIGGIVGKIEWDVTNCYNGGHIRYIGGDSQAKNHKYLPRVGCVAGYFVEGWQTGCSFAKDMVDLGGLTVVEWRDGEGKYATDQRQFCRTNELNGG